MSRSYRLMGVINVTPDSFSDGGLFLDEGAAIAHGRQLIAEGADILDIGGESTRPGAEPVGADQEMARVGPVIAGLTEAAVTISIDTSKACVARLALDAGAAIVNDVTALRGDREMAPLIAERQVDCCLMHMLGEPRTMQRGGGPKYGDVVAEVKSFLTERLEFAVGEGIEERRVMLDPGIGFGKTVADNLELLRRLGELAELGRPIVIGTSRKRFLSAIAPGERGEGERLPGTIATNVLAYERGASVFRVHDVAPVRDALAAAAATLGAR